MQAYIQSSVKVILLDKRNRPFINNVNIQYTCLVFQSFVNVNYLCLIMCVLCTYISLSCSCTFVNQAFKWLNSI